MPLMKNQPHISARTALQSAPLGPSLYWRLIRLFALAWIWGHRHRSRHALALLDRHLLDDIGLTCTQARRECAKPVWER